MGKVDAELKKRAEKAARKFSKVPTNKLNLSPQEEAFYTMAKYLNNSFEREGNNRIQKSTVNLASMYGSAFMNSAGSNIGMPTVIEGNRVQVKPMANYLECYDIYDKVDIVPRCIAKITDNIVNKLNNVIVKPKEKHGRKSVTGQDIDYMMALFNRPNPSTTREEMISTILLELLLTGNCFAEKVVSRNKTIKKIYLDAKPYEMFVLIDFKEYKKGYQIPSGYAKVKSIGVDKVGYTAYDLDEIIHFRRPTSLDGLYGASIVKQERRQLIAILLMDNYRLAFFNNGMVNSKQIRLPEGAREEDLLAVKSYIESEYLGAVNAHKPIIMAGGAELSDIGSAPTEVGFLESHKRYELRVANAFGVPPTRLNLSEHTGLANSDTAEESSDFDNDVCDPLLKIILSKLTNEIAVHSGINDLEYHYQSQKVQGFTQLAATYTQLLEKGLMTPNNLIENLKLGDRIPEAWGDTRFLYAGSDLVQMKEFEKTRDERMSEGKTEVGVKAQPMTGKQQIKTDANQDKEKEEVIDQDPDNDGKDMPITKSHVDLLYQEYLNIQ